MLRWSPKLIPERIPDSPELGSRAPFSVVDTTCCREEPQDETQLEDSTATPITLIGIATIA